MLTLSGQERAERIAERAERIAYERAENEWPGDWTREQSWRDFVYMLRSMEATAGGTLWAPTVELRPRMRPDGGYWSYTSYEILESAAAQIDAESGDQHTFDHGHFEQGDGDYGVRLTWDAKPNLERLLTDEWGSTPPMVLLMLDGKPHFLDAVMQDDAGDVAYRYPARHRPYLGGEYAKALLRLAAALDVDTVTAQRVAEVAAPERDRGVDPERNPALHILSAEADRQVQRARPDTGCGPVESCPECGARPGEKCRAPGCSGQW